MLNVGVTKIFSCSAFNGSSKTSMISNVYSVSQSSEVQ